MARVRSQRGSLGAGHVPQDSPWRPEAPCPHLLGVRGIPKAQDGKVHLTEGGRRQVSPEYELPEALQPGNTRLGPALGHQGPRVGWGSQGPALLLLDSFVIKIRPF